MQELLPSTLTTEDMSNWSQLVEGEPQVSPSLDPQLEDFLGGEIKQVNTPTWWPELSMVPRERDVKEFARKVQALFELPKRRSCIQSTPNDYSAPPPLMPWAKIGSSQLGTCISEARSIDWSSQRRPWSMPRPYSTGQKKPSHHTQANHAN